MAETVLFVCLKIIHSVTSDLKLKKLFKEMIPVSVTELIYPVVI